MNPNKMIGTWKKGNSFEDGNFWSKVLVSSLFWILEFPLWKSKFSLNVFVVIFETLLKIGKKKRWLKKWDTSQNCNDDQAFFLETIYTPEN